MDHYCLSREEYKKLIFHFIFEGELEDDLNTIIERSQENWDINIIGSNYFLSKIIEQLIKQGKAEKNAIDRLYTLENNLYFTIDELTEKFIEYLYMHHLPKNYNYYLEEIKKAQISSDKGKENIFEEKIKLALEEDLHHTISKFYESKIHH